MHMAVVGTQISAKTHQKTTYLKEKVYNVYTNIIVKFELRVVFKELEMN